MAVSPHEPHILEPMEGPYRSFRCTRCDGRWSGVEPLDEVKMQTRGLGRCVLGVSKIVNNKMIRS